MDVMDAIKERRSIHRLKQDVPPKELIDKILEAGNWAPSHYKTEPWRFYVLSGQSRAKLGEVLANELRKSLDDPNSQESADKLATEAKKPLRNPVIIAVTVVPSDDPRVLENEEFAAASIAVQNMLLAAHSLGLGAKLKTGVTAYSEKVREFLGMHERERLIGFVNLGYAEGEAPKSSRGPFAEKTKWLS